MTISKKLTDWINIQTDSYCRCLRPLKNWTWPHSTSKWTPLHFHLNAPLFIKLSLYSRISRSEISPRINHHGSLRPFGYSSAVTLPNEMCTLCGSKGNDLLLGSDAKVATILMLNKVFIQWLSSWCSQIYEIHFHEVCHCHLSTLGGIRVDGEATMERDHSTAAAALERKKKQFRFIAFHSCCENPRISCAMRLLRLLVNG